MTETRIEARISQALHEHESVYSQHSFGDDYHLDRLQLGLAFVGRISLILSSPSDLICVALNCCALKRATFVTPHFCCNVAPDAQELSLALLASSLGRPQVALLLTDLVQIACPEDLALISLA